MIIGSGSEKNKLIKKINKLNLQKKIKLKNWKKNLNNEFYQSKIFLLPSLYEGCPNILIDAIANQIPCISSNCSGAEDILKNNKSGMIYPINNKKILIKNVFKILKNYDFYMKQAKIFSKTQKRFLINNQAKKYFEFLLN